MRRERKAWGITHERPARYCAPPRTVSFIAERVVRRKPTLKWNHTVIIDLAEVLL